jgi:predicted small lipoprotein YifL
MIRAAALLACLLLAACGQRGGLYIPDESRPTAVPATPPAAQLPAPAGTEDATATEEQRRRQQQAAPANNATGN